MIHHVLIIDDDKDLCALIKKYMEAENCAAALCHDGSHGLQEARQGGFHLVILDVMLPLKSGFDVLTELRKTSNVPVLMLTARDSEPDKISGLRLGADDYLTKPFSIQELTARALSLIRRYTALNPMAQEETASPLSIGGLDINPDNRTVLRDGRELELTAKEFDLLYFLARNPGKVFTKRQIYHQVWNEGYAFDDNNIMVHIRRLRKKIEPDPDNPCLVQTIWGVGYKFAGGQTP